MVNFEDFFSVKASVENGKLKDRLKLKSFETNNEKNQHIKVFRVDDLLTDSILVIEETVPTLED